jgi:NAD(P)-dependent dehydrogenase (short-subunit alcohol dehydrogenase family)
MAAAFARHGADVVIASRKLAACQRAAAEITAETSRAAVGLAYHAARWEEGPFRLSTLVAERMAAAGGGSIIMISSVTVAQPTSGELPCAAAKAALHTLSTGVAKTYGPRVRCNVIMPGAFLTDVAKSWDTTHFATVAADSIALGRAAEPDEITGTALYLASAASSYTTEVVCPLRTAS